MSLGKNVKVDDEGVTFRSHLDGTLVRLNAEKSIEVQKYLGSTITMTFDECIPYPFHILIQKFLCKGHQTGQKGL